MMRTPTESFRERNLWLFQVEDPRFLSEQLITYIGNKRALLDFIGRGVDRVRSRLGRKRLKTADLFSGSGVVARFLKRYSCELVVNDLERYCEVINRCYLANRSELDLAYLRDLHRSLLSRLTEENLEGGIISERYAPENDELVQPGERVFYTQRNARYLDTARRLIGQLPADDQPFFLAPLLSEASVHANTSGVFKGFYKDRETGIGRFGGRNGDALTRIMAPIALPFPLFSSFECEVSIYREDVNTLLPELGQFDLVYLDPPYNQHPYGSNYFMLNLLVEYVRPRTVSAVSGIPADWTRSAYNKRRSAFRSFADLIRKLNSKYLLISFNSEGFIPRDWMLGLLGDLGTVEVLEMRYNTFRGSRNLRNRSIHVDEYLFLLEKGRRPLHPAVAPPQ